MTRSAIKKRSVVIGDLRTSVSVEDAFWDRLCVVAGDRELTLGELISRIKRDRPASMSLSGAIRVFVLEDALGTGQKYR